MSDFKPWDEYPSLTRDRLSAIANIIRRVRTETVALHDAEGGDSEWCLGCRVYSRTCYAISAAAKVNPWLTIPFETENLRFSFAIGSVPFRFYRGKPNDPPDRYLISTFGELHHLQTALAIEGLRPVDKILRLAVETDGAREVSIVSFVEVDEAGNVTETYTIPFDKEHPKVSPLESKPVDLPAPALEPLAKEEEQKQEHGVKRNDKLGS